MFLLKLFLPLFAATLTQEVIDESQEEISALFDDPSEIYELEFGEEEEEDLAFLEEEESETPCE